MRSMTSRPLARNRLLRLSPVLALPLLFLLAPSVTWAADSEDVAPAAEETLAPPTLKFERGRFEIEGSAERPATEDIILGGRDARRQLLVSLTGPDGRERDVTRQATYSTAPEGIVEVSPSGYVIPLAAGKASIVATMPDGAQATQTIEVLPFDQDAPVSFPNQISPIFTKLSCNSGGCHGKAAGQNGFRLSLLGFEPRDDYDFLVREGRGRRLFPAAPEKSLLLAKATAQVPHGGGRRMEEDSHEYRLLRRWIEQGMPYGNDDDPRVEAVEVYPKSRVMDREGHQQLLVLARYTDGRIEDVTRTAQFESNDSAMASVDPQGIVSTRELAGDVTVMVRYQGHVGVFRATLPLTTVPPDLPEPTNLVDQAVFAKLAQLGIPTSVICDDATFIRRVTIDVAGRLPTLEETQTFLTDEGTDKRDRLIDRLVESEDHAEYFAAKWSQILRNRRDTEAHKFGSFALYQWLRKQFYENRPYSEIVRETVAASGSIGVHPPVAWYRQVSDINQQVEDTCQLFLGQRIQCARCHHHPFEKWSQRDYAQMAAFFSLVTKKAGPTPEEPIIYSRIGRPTAPDPRTGTPLPPAGLDGEDLVIAETEDPRQRLVDWMVAPENPFFARALVNRYWKHFFGRGLVDPEDDMRVTNPASNPELLDALAQHFIASGFDLRDLIRTIVRSKTYQLSSDANELNLSDHRSHSRFYPKRLPAEVLLDAIDSTLGTATQFAGVPLGTRAVSLPDTNFESYFLTVFGRPEGTTACECERMTDANLAQSLHLLNSKQMQSKLSEDGGRPAKFAAAVIEDATVPRDPRWIDELYLRALSRHATPEETQRILDYLGKQADRRLAIEDVFWAVVNSKEFLFNH